MQQARCQSSSIFLTGDMMFGICDFEARGMVYYLYKVLASPCSRPEETPELAIQYLLHMVRSSAIVLGALAIEQACWYWTPARAWRFPPMGNRSARYPATPIPGSVSDCRMSLLVSRFDAMKSLCAPAERRKLPRTGETFQICGVDFQSSSLKAPSLLVTSSPS